MCSVRRHNWAAVAAVAAGDNDDGSDGSDGSDDGTHRSIVRFLQQPVAKRAGVARRQRRVARQCETEKNSELHRVDVGALRS